MPIKYFPNRVFSKRSSPVDSITAKSTQYKQKGSHDATATALDVVVSSDKDWKASSIGLTFTPAATARNYAIDIVSGIRIVENLNDYLWLQVTGVAPQQVTLSPGFYTGTELAAHLQNTMDNMQAFSDKSITFTVTYTVATGVYEITPSAGQIRYLNVNTAKTLRTRDSICGFIFGLNVDTIFAASVSSDTPVPGYDDVLNIVSETGSTTASDYITDGWTLSLDEAIKITSSVAAVVINYSVNYEFIK